MAEAEARIAESDARQVESAEVGILHSFPSAFVGGPPVYPAGYRYGAAYGGYTGLPGCNRRLGSFGRSYPLAVPLQGTGGAFVAMNEGRVRVGRR